MKIRIGFVSNSSTSSFVIIASKESIVKAFEKFNKNEIELVTQMMGEGVSKKINGKSYDIFFGEISSESCYEWAHQILCDQDKSREDQDYDEEAEKLADAWDTFLTQLSKQKDCLALNK